MTEPTDRAPGPPDDITNLEQLLDRLIELTRQNELSVDTIMDTVGRRSFGPILLLAGMMILVPIVGDIPGVPTLIAIFVFLIAVQLLLGREYFWLPQWLLRRTVTGDKLKTGLKYLYRPARFVDRFIKPRLFLLVNGYAKYAVALTTIAISLGMPVMEVIPFSANAAGIVLLGFGLSLIARDGLMNLLSFLLAVTSSVLIAVGTL